jgi:hypothetical protein
VVKPAPEADAAVNSDAGVAAIALVAGRTPARLVAGPSAKA